MCSSTSVMPTPASPDVQRYRGAVIGAGGTARQSHLPALRTVAGVRARIDIVAVVDSAPDVPPVDGIPLLSDRAQLAQVGPLDFIDICTPTDSHLDLTLWGLERGYHVVCEKPVALTRAEADRIAAAARAHGRVVMPCHQYRFNPGWVKVKEWLREGAIGRHDFSAELDKAAYHRWFACLFESFIASLDRADPVRAAAPYLDDIRRVAVVVEHAYQAANTGCRVAIPDHA